MPKMGLRESFELETRNKYTKIECELGISINGRELPSMSVVGEALEKAIKLIEDAVAESYKVVPPRDVNQPVSELPSMSVQPVNKQPVQVNTASPFDQ